MTPVPIARRLPDPAAGTPLLGRDAELGALHGLVAAAANGSGAVAVVVGGDAGVGKSRLVAELTARADEWGIRCLIGRCVNLPDGGVPYLPFVDAFRDIDSEAWRRLEPHLRGPTEKPLSQLQLYDAVVAVLVEVAQDAPVCLVIEDAHWCDRPSRDLLRYLIGRLTDERIAVLVTYRSDDVDRRHPLRPLLADISRIPMVQRLSLGPLAANDIAALVAASGPLPPEVVDDIVARADGNAFFAEELAEAARSDGPPRNARRAGARVLPDALADVLTARLEQLDPSAAAVVSVAAVAGRRVGHRVLADVSGLPEPELEAALREAVARHVLAPDADAVAYEFRHALMQEAAYADLLPGERARLHRCYAQVLATDVDENASVAAELAHHAELCHDLPLALEASLRAADQARCVHAPSEAGRHLERALSLWHAVPDAAARTGTSEVEVHLLAAEAAGAGGDAMRAAALLEAADELVRADADADPERRTFVRTKLATARYHAGDDRAEPTSAEAAALAEDLPQGATRALAFSTHAVILFACDRPGAQDLAERALADAEAIGAANLQAEALVTLARVAQQEGDLAAATAYLTRALSLARDSGDIATELRTLFNLGMSSYHAGDVAATLQWTTQSVERSAANGMTDSEYARATRRLDFSARFALGDWDAAATRDMHRVPATVRAARDAFAAHVAVARGRPDAAQLLARLKDAGEMGSDIDVQVGTLAALGEIELLTWRGDPAAATRRYREVAGIPLDQWPADTLERLWLDALGLAALADSACEARLREDRAAVQALVAEGETVMADAQAAAADADRRGVRPGAEDTAWLTRAEAELSRLKDERDEAPWRRALQAFGFGYEYEAARCRWRLAEVLADRDPDEAADLLRSAYRRARDLGAQPLATAVTASARRARISGVGEDPSGAATLLTARESEVLTALARGRTNRQIGAELYISDKTASVHVSNILAKLGAATRGEAVAIARARGLV